MNMDANPTDVTVQSLAMDVVLSSAACLRVSFLRL